MNNILYINTSDSEKIFVSLSRDKNIDDISLVIKRGEMSNKLLRTIEKILDKSAIKTDKLDGILVYLGPGPYTSLRVGISTANTLGYVLNIPIYGIKKDEDFSEALQSLSRKKLKKTFSKPVSAYYQQAL